MDASSAKQLKSPEIQELVMSKPGQGFLRFSYETEARVSGVGRRGDQCLLLTGTTIKEICLSDVAFAQSNSLSNLWSSFGVGLFLWQYRV